ncbi:MAG: J domain-containing protein, partial [Gammaproteobacteria bacterium]
QAHRQALHRQVSPLKARHAQAMREMALFLAQRLEGKLLSAVQRETARQILCGLASTLAQDGDADMAALHDRHSPRTLADLEQARAADLRAQIETALGESLQDVHDGASADEVLAAGMERLRQSVQAEQESRREAAAQRKARRKPGKAQAAAQAQLDDAQTTLRKLFRQLASALHPDREPDAKARQEKTALMSEANAAYERKDLVALMQIQQRALLADPLAAARMSDEKLAALTRLLKQQVADLERERANRNDRLAAEFHIGPGFGVTPRTLQMVLNEQVAELEDALMLMGRDLQRVQEDAGLKRWLTEQRQESRRQRRETLRNDFFF